MTELQQALMDYLHARMEAGSEPPQTSDVVRHFRLRRQGGMARMLDGLAASGHIAEVNGRWIIKNPAVQLHLIPVEGAEPKQR
jgi:hypothetical protein